MRKKVISVAVCTAIILSIFSTTALATDISAQSVSQNVGVGQWFLSNAYYDKSKQHFVLTEDYTDWDTGGIWYNNGVETDITVELDYYTGSSIRKDGGGDGMAIAFFADCNYEMTGGQNLGFSGSKGYGIELDTRANCNQFDGLNDPTYYHIALISGDVKNHIITEQLPEVKDEQWHHFKLVVEGNACSAYIDNELKIAYENLQPTGHNWIGITAATGAAQNLHAVKNVYINGKELYHDEAIESGGCFDEFVATMPTLSPEHAKVFLSFLTSNSENLVGDAEASKFYKLITGDVSEYNGNLLKLQADLLAMSTFIRAQNVSKIEKQAQVSKFAADATVDLAMSFVPSGGTVSDADLGVLSGYEKKVEEYLTQGIIDFTNETIFYGKYGGSLDAAIENINVAMSGFNQVKGSVGTATDIINGIMVAVCGLKYACASELEGIYGYFDYYLDHREYYDSESDQAFKSLLEVYIGAESLRGDVFNSLLRLLSIPHLQNIFPVLNIWAEYTYSVEEYVATKDRVLSSAQHEWDISFTQTTGDIEETVYICSVCGTRKVESPPVCSHNLSKISAKQPSCTEDGYEEYWRCTYCGKLFSDSLGSSPILTPVSISALGHSPVNKWEYNESYHWHSCQNDATEQLDKASHTWDDGVISTPATCLTTGIKTFSCTVCGEIKTEVIEALRHSPSEDWTSDETCHWHTCKRGCGERLSEMEHTWDGGEITTSPTQTNPGTITYECTVCGRTKTDEIPMLHPTPAEVIAGETTVSDVPPTIKEDDAALANEMKELLEGEDGVSEHPIVDPEMINDAANDIAKNNTLTGESDIVKDALEDAEVSTEGTDITIVVQTYLKVLIVDANVDVGAITLDIAPMYRTIATTADVDEDEIVLEGVSGDLPNAVQIREEPLPISDPLTITLPLPNSFAGQENSLYIKHVKENGKTYFYTGAVAENVLTFTNPHGFSSFTVTKNNEAKAEINGIGYASLQDAIADVESGGTIKLLANDSAVVSDEISFTIEPGSFKATISAGSGYEMAQSGNTYIFTEKTGGGGSTGGGGGGGGSAVTTYTLTFDTNGGTAIAKVTKNKGTTINLSDYTTTREGYTFAGWYADEGLTDKVTSITLNANKTVYAKWTENVPVEPALPFTDVKEGDWFYDAVCYVYENDMMNGVSENSFAPNGTTSRAMLVTILYRLEKEPAVSGSSFTDVASGQWYTNAVAWAAENGIVNGVTDTTFAPNSPITREQMAAILYRYADWKGCDVSGRVDLSGYTDAASVSGYATEAMAWANAEGLITGVTDTTLRPGGSAIRAQAATILMRLCEDVLT